MGTSGAEYLKENKQKGQSPGIRHGGIWGCVLPWWSMIRNMPANSGNSGLIPGSGRSPGEEMASHSSILAWRIPWTKEPGGLVARVGQDLTIKQQQWLEHRVKGIENLQVALRRPDSSLRAGRLEAAKAGFAF